jgi:flagellar basal body L-ring protein FlgH
MCDEEMGMPRNAAWDKFLDGYLWILDKTWNLFGCVQKKGNSVNLSHPLVEPNSKLLVKMTTGALFLVFAIVLCSCAQPRRELSPSRFAESSAEPRAVMRKPSNSPVRSPESSQDASLYVKRETVVIKKKESGSSTGSLWADARVSRNLFAEERPERVGDVITISIPEDLRYAAPAANAAQSANPASTAAGETSVAPGVGTGEPLKEFRMEVIAIESSGDMYLRGVREYKHENGRRMVAVNAKIPRRKVRASQLDARDLTAVTVNEDMDGRVADYESPGWDKVVSRKISGFVPDVNAELASVEDARKELETSREALRQQTQALQEERERLLKDRARMAKAAEAAEAAKAAETAKEETQKSESDEKSGEGDAPAAKAGKATKDAKNGKDVKSDEKAKSAKGSKAVGGTTP